MSARVKQGQATQRLLVKIARKNLAQKGYAATTTQEIIQEAGVTKGALYHHFPSKPALFEAVYREVEAEMGEKIRLASESVADPFEQLVAGCLAYLDCCCQGDLHRILRLEGPAALGQQKWHDIDREFGVYRLLPFLETLADNKSISVASVEAFAFQITGAMNEATFWVTQHPKPGRALRDSKRVLRHLLESVRGTTTAAS